MPTCFPFTTLVLCELCSALKDGSEALAVLEEMSIRYLPTEARSALRAGEMQRRHRQRGGGDVRAVPDFLTGAHALMQCSGRSEEHTSELQSLMRISYAVFCLKKKTH